MIPPWLQVYRRSFFCNMPPPLTWLFFFLFDSCFFSKKQKTQRKFRDFDWFWSGLQRPCWGTPGYLEWGIRKDLFNFLFYFILLGLSFVIFGIYIFWTDKQQSEVEKFVGTCPSDFFAHVVDNAGAFVGHGLYSPKSQIALRIISRNEADILYRFSPIVFLMIVFI